MVLDPFCGCATACVAAEKLGRKWVGIDLSLKAVELVNMRLQREMGSLFHHGYVTARTDIPHRTDIDTPSRIDRTSTYYLAGKRAVATAARRCSPSSSLRSTTLCPCRREERTTLATCNYSVATAIGPRGTSPRNSWWHS